MALSTISLQELGYVSHGVTLSRHASNQGENYKIITVKDLENLYVREVQEQVRLASNVKQYHLLENDVVIAIRGTLLKASVVTPDLEGSLSNQNTVFFRRKSEAINPLYLAALLRSTYYEQLLYSELQRSTTTLRAVRVSDVRALEIPLPDLHTQDEIAELFLDLEEFKQVALSEIESQQKLGEFALLQTLEK